MPGGGMWHSLKTAERYVYKGFNQNIQRTAYVEVTTKWEENNKVYSGK